MLSESAGLGELQRGLRQWEVVGGGEGWREGGGVVPQTTNPFSCYCTRDSGCHMVEALRYMLSVGRTRQKIIGRSHKIKS